MFYCLVKRNVKLCAELSARIASVYADACITVCV